MRILFVSQYFVPEMGAPAVRTYDNCRRWVADGHEVQVITNVPNHPAGKLYPGYQNRLWQWETIDGIEVLRVLTFLTPNKGRVLRSLQYVVFLFASIIASLFVRKPDVVVGTSPQFLVALAGWAIAALQGVPFVFEVRDLWPDSILAVGAFTNPAIIGVLRMIEQFLYRRAAHIVVVTESFRDRIIEKGIAPGKISVVFNSVDTENFEPRPANAELLRRHGLEGKFVVGYLGTHGMAHGLETLLGAAHELRHDDRIQFLFVGEGAEKAKLKSRTRELRLGNVLFVDQQSRESMPDWVASTDLHVVHLRPNPLFKTTIPSKIFEIMGAGRPMVVAVDGEARSIVERMGAGVFSPPGDARALARTISGLVSNPSAREDMGVNGRAAALTIFNRDLLAAQYAAVLRRVIHGAPPDRRLAPDPAEAVRSEA